GLERRAEPGEGQPGVALAAAPRGEVVGAHDGVEAGLLGVDGGVAQVARVGLLVLRVESDDGHGLALPTPKDSPSLPAASLPGSVRTNRSVTDALRVDHYGAADRASEGAGVHRRVLVVM